MVIKKINNNKLDSKQADEIKKENITRTKGVELKKTETPKESKIQIILEIKNLIEKQDKNIKRFEEVTKLIDNYQKRGVVVGDETKKIIQKTNSLIEELTSIKDRIEELELQIPAEIEITHTGVEKKIEKLKANIDKLEEELDKIARDNLDKAIREINNNINSGFFKLTIEEANTLNKALESRGNVAEYGFGGKNKFKEDGKEISKNKNKKDTTQKTQEAENGNGGLIGKIKEFYEKSREETKEFFKKFLGIGNKETNPNPKAEEIEGDVEELRDLFKKWQKDPKDYTVPFYIKKNELYRKYGEKKIDEIIEQMIERATKWR